MKLACFHKQRTEKKGLTKTKTTKGKEDNKDRQA